MEKRFCHYCLHLRPRKGDLCSILKIKIKNPKNFYCSEYSEDVWLIRYEEKIEKEG